VGTSILKIQLKIMSKEERSSNDPSPPFQEKEKEGEGRSKAWRSMEGEGEGSHPWWPIESERKILFTSSHFPPNQIYLNL
jgi:hypothetical protein